MATAVTAALLATSTSPRATRTYMESLATERKPDLYSVMYSEAKLRISDRQIDTARALLQQCPPSYRHTGVYLRQVAMYEDLCAAGVIKRKGVEDVLTLLAEVLHEDAATNRKLLCYADRLVAAGYNREALYALTTTHVREAMECCGMVGGHRCLFDRYVAERTPAMERLVSYVVTTVERCVGVGKCIATLRRSTKDAEGDEVDGNGVEKEASGEEEEETHD